MSEPLLEYYRNQFGISKEEEANILRDLMESAPKTLLGNQLVKERLGRVQAERRMDSLGAELVAVKLKLMKAGM